MKKLILFRSSLLVLLLLLNTFFTRAQSQINPVYATILQTALDSLREENGVKGMYAALYIPGQGIWQGVTGVSYGSHYIDTNMLFDIGSTTKTFVAAEIMKLIDEGMFELDDTISNLLPPMEYVTPEITVRQLLQHKSGLGEYLSLDWQNAMFDDLTRRWYSPETMDSFLTAPTGVPGGPWNYRNTNYVLLGMIAEAFRGDSLHNILRDDILTPLVLNNTYMEMFESYENDVAHNWSTPTFDPDLAVDVSWYPHEAMFTSTSFAGGYFCTAADLATWGYNLYSGKVLSQSSLDEMLNFTSVAGGYFNGYGLGCMRFVGNSGTYYGHAGNFFGYAASMLYDPIDSLCLALLVNTDCLSPYIAMPLMKIARDNLSLTTGVENPVAAEQLNVYPNPVNSDLHIQLSITDEITVEIFNMEGKMVYNQTRRTDHFHIDARLFPEGLYLIKIIEGKTVLTQKMVVHR